MNQLADKKNNTFSLTLLFVPAIITFALDSWCSKDLYDTEILGWLHYMISLILIGYIAKGVWTYESIILHLSWDSSALMNYYM